jgi:hypothetical protein
MINATLTCEPLGIPAAHAAGSALPSAMFTSTMISLTVTWVLPSQSPTQEGKGVAVGVSDGVCVTTEQLPLLAHTALRTGMPPAPHCPFAATPQAPRAEYSQQVSGGSAVGVLVGVSVGVLVGVLVGAAVFVGVAVRVAVGVGVFVGVCVDVLVGVRVGVTVGV